MDEDDDDGVGGVGSRDQAKLNVRFVTSLPEELRVVETPFEVPSDFARLGEQLFFSCVSCWEVGGEGKKADRVMTISVLLLRDS